MMLPLRSVCLVPLIRLSCALNTVSASSHVLHSVVLFPVPMLCTVYVVDVPEVSTLIFRSTLTVQRLVAGFVPVTVTGSSAFLCDVGKRVRVAVFSGSGFILSHA